MKIEQKNGKNSFLIKYNANRRIGRLKHLYMAHPDAIKAYKKNSDILLLDCTYKTNKFKMPLLNIGSVTPNKCTIQTALVFLSGEKEEDYHWAMK
jgi:hypothetical protein